MPGDTDTCDVEIDADLVAGLVARQFRQWSDRTVTPIVPGGWDNRSFRLGDDLVVRLPSHARYAEQVEKEQRWLPILGPMLPCAVPSPIAMGEPGGGYPWRWSISRWLDGEPASAGNIVDVERFAEDLAQFLRALQRAEAAGGPTAGEHNFYRGGPVATYDHEVRKAISGLRGHVDARAATTVWEKALTSSWGRPAVWVHGDVAASNLLVRDGRLAAVIDFGSSGVGDPACDLTVAWTLFIAGGRKAFQTAMAIDHDTWTRARGWALWKALTLIHRDDGPAPGVWDPWRTLREVLSDDLDGC